jgi:hypothetical protein
MQLVELETQGGKRIWINPAQVVTMGPSASNIQITDIAFAPDTHKPLSFKGTPADNAKKVNDGLKA